MPSLAERLVDLNPIRDGGVPDLDRRLRIGLGPGTATPRPQPDAFIPDHEPPAELVLVQNVKVALEYLARQRNGRRPGDVSGPLPPDRRR